MAYTAFHELRQQPQPVQATRQTKPRPEKFRNILAYLTYAADNGLPRRISDGRRDRGRCLRVTAI